MSAISLLALILFGLMLLVGGKEGITAYFSVILNFLILFLVVILITGGRSEEHTSELQSPQ